MLLINCILSTATTTSIHDDTQSTLPDLEMTSTTTESGVEIDTTTMEEETEGKLKLKQPIVCQNRYF